MSEQTEDVEFVKKQLTGDTPDELLEQIATTVVDQMADSFPELSFKSRPIEVVLEEFRNEKLDDIESTDQYGRKIDYLQTYLIEEIKINSTEELTRKDIEGYRDWRKYESLSREEPLADNTLSDDMYLYREFIQYLIEFKMVPARFEKAVEIPDIDYGSGEGVDEKKLDPTVADAALDYLRKYEYASVEHVSMELMCQSGPRKGGLIGRDVSDFNYEDKVLLYETNDSTPLKNDESSEREITLYGQISEIIKDYLEHQRPDETDQSGREPLLTKGNGRMSPSTLQKIAYKWTRPCEVGLECPHDRDPEDCEAAQGNNSAFKCPSSRAPHHIRSGYITDQRNRGVSPEGIDHRCDVSRRVQGIHYDQPDKTEKRERFEDEFRNAEDNPNSGFEHN